MLRRLLSLSILSFAVVILGPATAFACGGLVAPGHAEALQRATTLAAWHGGFEHYITGFQFIGSADRFGYIIPLPGVPSKIEKGGEWTLERLEREVSPVKEGLLFATAAAGRDSKVEVLQRVTVDALDIVVVRGGGRDVAAWAGRNGFDLTPDTPQVMQRYSSAGAIFALAKFDNKEAVRNGLVEGQGTVIHFTIPTKAPWIPLQILALGKSRAELVDADLFILTDEAPSLSFGGAHLPGVRVRSAGQAEKALLQDLRSDRGMNWVPTSGMWFTALSIRTPAAFIGSDLSIDGGGPIAVSDPAPPVTSNGATWSIWLSSLVAAVGIGFVWLLWRPVGPPVRPA
jgi:hypothetical protein